MKIKLLIALWRRPEITRICFDGIKRLQQFIDIEPICIYSEDDMKVLCDEYKFEAHYHENLPLGKKLNYGLNIALQSEWDYLMQIGSDDLLSEKIFEYYKPFIEKSVKAFGIKSVHFYNTIVKKSYHVVNSYPFGVGRMVHRSVFEDDLLMAKFRYNKSVVGEKVVARKGDVIEIPLYIAERKINHGEIIGLKRERFKMWPDAISKGLDFNSEFNLNRRGVEVKIVEIGSDVLALDIKSEVNIWGTDQFDEVNYDVLNYFPEGDAIRQLR